MNSTINNVTEKDIYNLKKLVSFLGYKKESKGYYSNTLPVNLRHVDSRWTPLYNLWEHGFTPRFDGRAWYLCVGKNFDVVYKLEKRKKIWQSTLD